MIFLWENKAEKIQNSFMLEQEYPLKSNKLRHEVGLSDRCVFKIIK